MMVRFLHTSDWQIHLPDIQRPFIWKNTKVRGLCCLVP